MKRNQAGALIQKTPKVRKWPKTREGGVSPKAVHKHTIPEQDRGDEVGVRSISQKLGEKKQDKKWSG